MALEFVLYIKALISTDCDNRSFFFLSFLFFLPGGIHVPVLRPALRAGPIHNHRDTTSVGVA